jgi:hypothetical protein
VTQIGEHEAKEAVEALEPTTSLLGWIVFIAIAGAIAAFAGEATTAAGLHIAIGLFAALFYTDSRRRMSAARARDMRENDSR